MKSIPIYRDEVDAGIGDIVKSQASVSYCTSLKPWTPTEDTLSKILASVKRSKPDIDLSCLYPTESILVSSNWNKNDDVFPREDTWAARHTPCDKPTNLEHDENQIVGHMISSWVIDDDNKLVDDNTIISDLPPVFHICNGAVIYKTWAQQELIDRTNELITAIEGNNKFVSMECWFTNFDYAVISDNQFHVVARNDETAFLTKHLKAYGGSGQFEHARVGRLLRNITFTGRGYVDKPANPNSIIFNLDDNVTVDFANAKSNNPFDASAGVFLAAKSVEDSNDVSRSELMTSNDNSILQGQIDVLTKKLEASELTTVELQKKVAEAGTVQLESTIEELTQQLETTNTKASELETAKTEADTRITELTSKVEELTSANEKLNESVAAVQAEKVKANRISTLVDGGVDKEEASTKVDAFANLTDEQFVIVAESLIVKADKPTDNDADTSSASDDVDTDPAADAADTKVVDNADASQAAAGSVEPQVDDEVQTAVAALQEEFAEYFGVAEKVGK